DDRRGWPSAGLSSIRQPASQERPDHEHRHSRRPHPPMHEAAFPTPADPLLDALPDLAAIFWAALGNRRGIHRVEHQLQRPKLVAAGFALFEMALDHRAFTRLSVVEEHQLFFANMIHLAVLTNGSR